MQKKLKIIETKAAENGLGRVVKAMMPCKIEKIVDTINPDIVALHLSCEVYSLYEGRLGRSDMGWTMQKDYMKSIGIPEEYYGWNMYAPEIRTATDNCQRFVLNRLGLKEGDYINDSYIARIECELPLFIGQPQVLYFNCNYGKQHTVNTTGLHVDSNEKLMTLIEESANVTWVEIIKAYYPRYVLYKYENTIVGLEDSDIAKAVKYEDVWVEVATT